jgi:prolyl-tRNA editing enzyme YbaK/EbsC (Cys-tRNA(Pro) deacylase)
MSLENVREYLKQFDKDGSIIELDVSTATVRSAAAALKVEEARIAKSIALRKPDNKGPGSFIVVTAGDTKIDNKKFKSVVGFKAQMLSPEEALFTTGHAIGGVCPFALPVGISVFLDNSLQRFATVFPACGSSNSAIELTCAEIEKFSAATCWIDVCCPLV